MLGEEDFIMVSRLTESPHFFEKEAHLGSEDYPTARVPQAEHLFRTVSAHQKCLSIFQFSKFYIKK